jgi:hypothetical protein
MVLIVFAPRLFWHHRRSRLETRAWLVIQPDLAGERQTSERQFRNCDNFTKTNARYFLGDLHRN